MWKCVKILLGFYMLVLGDCSLLEMSQTMWAKLLSGGLSKVGQLDPLRVPMVKIDQSEGNTSYRMVLRDIEISGLNDSTIESIHVGRGKLRSNLSELEAGYVTYSDLGDLESIRYKFHTVVNNMRRNVADQSQRTTTAYENTSEINYGNDERRRGRASFDERLSNDYRESRDRISEYTTTTTRKTTTTTDSNYLRNLRIEERMESRDIKSRYPSSVHVIYAQSLNETKADRGTYANDRDEPDCSDGKSASKHDDGSSLMDVNDHGNLRSFEQGRRDLEAKSINEEGHEDVHVSASENKEIKLERPIEGSSSISSSYQRDQQRRDYKTNDNFDKIFGTSDQRTERSSTVSSYYANQRRDYQRSGDVDRKIGVMSQRSESIRSVDRRLENRPGYIDIIYADENNSNGVKHFGNMKLQASRDTKVYGFEDVMKDIRENAMMFAHNFTEGESLTKMNDRIKKALEANRLKDLARYAENYQEREGYFEEGMELIYHYGGMGNESKEVRRIKRAHPENDSEDDVMHVIMRIRVPLLRVKSQYMLTGKVGEEILRGNGLLAGNFTDLLGDFTVELKKGDNDSMTVRATRAKLTSKDKSIDLQGMNEEGPVKSILTQGLMAAEAVAAMLADDLTTKALSEKTADAMVYRMYNDLPPMVN